MRAGRCRRARSVPRLRPGRWSRRRSFWAIPGSCRAK
jgi:hypothetical protein